MRTIERMTHKTTEDTTQQEFVAAISASPALRRAAKELLDAIELDAKIEARKARPLLETLIAPPGR